MKMGIDVSKWQGKMDWQKAKQAGAEFALIRAGSIDNVTGQCYTDYQFERNADLAPQYMDEIGFYWFLRPNHNPIKQSDYFLGLLLGKTYQLRKDCDIEVAGQAEVVRTFCEAIGGPDQAMIYTNLNTVNYLLAGDKAWMGNYQLHLADWSPPPYVFYPWQDYYIWQSGPAQRGFEFGAESTAIDIDWMPGQPTEAIIMVDGLSLRSEPRFAPDTLFGRGIKGTRVQISDEVVNGYRRITECWGWDAGLRKV